MKHFVIRCGFKPGTDKLCDLWPDSRCSSDQEHLREGRWAGERSDDEKECPTCGARLTLSALKELA